MKRRGFTVIEALVSAALLLALLGGIYVVMLAGIKYFQQSQTFSGVQQEGIKGLNRVVKDLSNSVPDQLTINPGYLWFLVPQQPLNVGGPVTYTANGDVNWQKWVCYYHDVANQQLVRSEIALAAPTPVSNPAPLPVPTLVDFKVAPQRDTVARRVSGFQVTQVAPRLMEISVTVEDLVAVAANSNADKLTRVPLTTRITLKNT